MSFLKQSDTGEKLFATSVGFTGIQPLVISTKWIYEENLPAGVRPKSLNQMAFPSVAPPGYVGFSARAYWNGVLVSRIFFPWSVAVDTFTSDIFIQANKLLYLGNGNEYARLGLSQREAYVPLVLPFTKVAFSATSASEQTGIQVFDSKAYYSKPRHTMWLAGSWESAPTVGSEWSFSGAVKIKILSRKRTLTVYGCNINAMGFAYACTDYYLYVYTFEFVTGNFAAYAALANAVTLTEVVPAGGYSDPYMSVSRADVSPLTGTKVVRIYGVRP